MPNIGSSTFVDGLTSTQHSKLYEILNTWMKQIQIHLQSNITHSDSYCCYSIHDGLKFIGEHNTCRILSST